MREKYYKDMNTAGPQSRLLEGLTWDEARRIRDEALVKALGPGAVSASLPDSHSTVAAASKAILHRDVRDAALVYEVSYRSMLHQVPSTCFVWILEPEGKFDYFIGLGCILSRRVECVLSFSSHIQHLAY